MKNILVPTDFSACASQAVEVALALAELTGAVLHMYSCIEVPANWAELSEKDREIFPEAKQKIHNTELLFADWRKDAIEREITIKTSWSGGELLENIKSYVEEFEIDFIVMGSHGTSGKNEFFIGSNTQRVVRILHQPILIIKEALQEYSFKKVIFASNFETKEKAAFEYFLKFIEPFEPEIHLVAINTPSFFFQPYILIKEAMNDFVNMAAPLVCKSHFYKDYSVDSGIRHFSEEIGAQLIAISNLTRRPLKRMLAGSNVEALVNHAQIPVLSIDYLDDKDQQSNKKSISNKFFSSTK